MRLAFFVLLLANLVLYAWGQGYWGGSEEGREPERLQRQLVPEKLRLLVEAPPAPVAASACKRLEWLSAGEADALAVAVAALPDWALSRQPRQEPPAHWVVMAELSSRALAEKKKGELRALGVNEGEIVEDAALGPYAISLGVFRGQQTAEEHLRSLVKKGVRSARLAQRQLPPEKFALELRAPANGFVEKLAELTAPLAQVERMDCANP